MAGKKFQFKLESVRQLREHAAQKAKRELAYSMKRRRAQEVRVKDAAERLKTAAAYTIPDGQQRAASFQRLETARQTAHQALRDARKELAACQEEERQFRLTLRERQAELEAMETLRESAFQAHQQAEAMAESKRIEEQALDAFRRKDRTYER